MKRLPESVAVTVTSAIALFPSSLSENDAGAIVGDLTTTDADNGDTHTYTVSDSRFTVVNSQLKLIDGISLNHEAEASVVGDSFTSVTVMATAWVAVREPSLALTLMS